MLCKNMSSVTGPKNTVNYRVSVDTRTYQVSAAGGAAPLSYGEERTAVRQGHGQGAPGRI